MIIEFFKSLLLGIVEGITEWLPVSSTGHMILVNEFIGNSGFTSSDLYLYVIQLGAILAVVTLYFHKLNPFSPKKTAAEKSDTRQMWYKVIIGCMPAAVIGLALNDFMDNFENWYVVSATLIIYGIAFLFIEKRNGEPKTTKMSEMSYKTAILIGMFQVLSIVPGTSRSGSTILGAIILGCSRTVAAEFSFFMAIPVMFGVSFLKLVTCDIAITAGDAAVLLVGMIVAYAVSMIVIKSLMEYVKNHDFKLFGKYRIVLGIIVVAYFSIKALVFQHI